MNDIFAAAVEVQGFCTARNWQFCIIGGLAVIRWGEPRATRDVDFTLLTGFGDEERFVRQLTGRFNARGTDAAAFALRNRVLLLTASNGVPVDVALAGIGYEETLIGRATPFEFASAVSLLTCSAEDLIVLKTFAGRTQDWTAIEGVLMRQRGKLDWLYIYEQLTPLCELKEEPELVERLRALQKRLG